MNTLLLVDLDAVLRASRSVRRGSLPIPGLNELSSAPIGALRWLEPDDGSGDPAGWPDAPRTVVTIAVGGATASGLRLTFHYVRRFAARLASLLMASAPVLVEIALTPNAPGASLLVLRRLLEHAPDRRGAISAEQIGVVTDDELFASQIRHLLGTHGAWRSAAAGLELVELLRREPGSRPLSRTAVSAWNEAELAPPTLARPEATWSSPIDTRGLALHVRERSMDLPAQTELFDIAGFAEWTYPSLYSQIGPTLRSLRGIARLASLPSSPPLFGDCSAAEGIEVKEGAPPPLSSMHVKKDCTIGPGGVTLQSERRPEQGPPMLERATLRTQLAEETISHLIRQAGLAPSRGVWQGWLNDDDAIAAMQPFPISYPPDVVVAFRVSGGGRARADVETRMGVPAPAAWSQDGHVTSTLDITEFASRFPRHQMQDGVLRVAAAPARRYACSDEIVMVSPIDPDGALVRAPARISGGTIGVGFAGSHDVALLAPSASIAAGEVRAVPIQRVDCKDRRVAALHPWLRARWQDLQRLPIVVAFDPVAPSRSWALS